MSMTIARRRNNNGFLDTEEELFTGNVCFLKTFDTFWLFNGTLSYPQPVNQLEKSFAIGYRSGLLAYMEPSNHLLGENDFLF